ncbi:MAG: hypothetical protein FWF88_04610 [Peptococcaceae bacterium]|nr:hypothetical protein [Peptococcaceae bacterium]
MKPKSRWLASLFPFALGLLLGAQCFVTNAFAEATSNLILNGDCEDSIPLMNCNNGTSTFTLETNPANVKDGKYALGIKQNNSGAHAGYQAGIERDSWYDFEYDIKILSDANGGILTGTNSDPLSKVWVGTNFMFPDTNASAGRHHVVLGVECGVGEWTHIAGSWKTSPADPNAKPEEAWFAIYPHVPQSVMFVVDNVKLVKRGQTENLVPNGDCEDAIPLMNCNNGTSAFTLETNPTNVKDGKYALRIKQNNSGAHAGYQAGIERDCWYDFEYDIKILSDANGGILTGTNSDPLSKVWVGTNFMFPDANASAGRHHVVLGVECGVGEWTHIAGSWKTSPADPNAKPEEAWFAIYPHVPQSVMYVVDNVKLVERGQSVTNLPAVFHDIDGPRTVLTPVPGNNTGGEAVPPEQREYPGWTPIGWSSLTTPGAEPLDSFPVSVSAPAPTYYGLYERQITLSYVDGDNIVKQEQMPQNANSGTPGEFTSTAFVVADNLSHPELNFAYWALDSVDGRRYNTSDPLTISENRTMYAVWQTPSAQTTSNLILNGDCEDSIPLMNCNNGTSTFTLETNPANVKDGKYALGIKQNNSGAHAGYQAGIERDSWYDFEYDIKILSDANGGILTGTNSDPLSKVWVGTNFMFPDTNASAGRHHVVLGVECGVGEWTHIAGSWKTSPADPNAKPEEAWFAIYPHVPQSVMFVVDNVKLVKRGQTENLVPNGDCEDAIPLMNCNNGTSAFTLETNPTNVKDGKYALRIKQNNSGAHAGYQAGIERDCWYDFEYDIKILSDANGGILTGTNSDPLSKVWVMISISL